MTTQQPWLPGEGGCNHTPLEAEDAQQLPELPGEVQPQPFLCTTTVTQQQPWLLVKEAATRQMAKPQHSCFIGGHTQGSQVFQCQFGVNHR